MTHLLAKISHFPIAFGGAAISGEGAGYGFGHISESDSIDLLHLAFDRGIKVFDTAPIYGFGLSEKRIGKAFKDKREEVFIVSKSGVTWHENKRVDMSNDPKVTEKMLHQSLIDLNSDYIDLYMVHWPDQKVDIRRPLEVISKAKSQGKIKHIGLCNTTIEDLNLAFEIDKIEVVQSEFNFFADHLKDSLFPYLKEKNISFMSWGTLDKGILTGRVDSKRKFDEVDCRSHAPWWKGVDHSLKFRAMERISKMLKDHGHTGLELALSYNLLFKDLGLALCGARNKDQLLSLFKALENLVSEDLIIEAKNLAKES